MWPFVDSHGLWLLLYLLTFCLHAVFVGYVLIGTGYALIQAVRRVEDPLAEQIRDRLPFMLGCGITAGVAPLLFLQLLYQRHFYSANLIMGPRWGAVVPALIAGFYALYIAKASVKWRRPALALAMVCFLFVAWSWTEMNQLMQAEPAWKTMYAAGERLYGGGQVWPRLVLWLGTMASLFAIVAAWSAQDRKRLAIIGLAGRVVSGAMLAYFASQAGPVSTHGWTYLFVAAIAVELVGWAAMLRTPEGAGLLVVTAGATGALVAGAVVREAPRLAIVEAPRAAAIEASGLPVFVATFLLGVVVIVWVVKTIRRAS
jgi:hypothetical protein